MTNQATPSLLELLLMECLIGLVFILTLSHFESYTQAVGKSFDNAGYISIARDIRSGHLSDLTPKLFWGTSYAIAAVSTVFRVPEDVALLAISVLCSGGAIWLAFRIWGAWIAAFFLVLNLPWIQLTFEGGSEPLFVFLIFASLFLAREEKWLWAAFFSSLATIVRPAGFFALAAVGLVLVYQKHYRKLLTAVLIGLSVGLAYVLPLWVHFGDPLATYHGYSHDWDNRSSPIGFPFYALIKGMSAPGRPVTNLLLNTGWICFSILGLVLLFRKRSKQAAQLSPVDNVFVVLYSVFLFTYNSSYWSYAEFPRFVIPAIPILLVGFESYLPKNRAVLWTLAVVSAVLAALSAFGIHNILGG